MKLFNILPRYVCRSFVFSFLITLLCLFIIIVLFDFAELQRRVGSRDIAFLLKLNMVLLRAPHFLEQVLPFLVFASSLFIFWRLNRSNELIVIRSMGVSLWRLILPIGLAAILLSFVDLAIFNPLSSAMHARYEKLDKKFISKKKDEIKIASTGLWLSEKSGVDQVIYRADKIDLKKLEFKNLNLIYSSPDNQFLKRVDAKKAFIRDHQLILKDGWTISAGKSAEPFSEKTFPTRLSNAKIRNMKETKSVFSFWKLPSYIKLLNTAGLQSIKYQMIWHSMLASVFWAGAMVLLAAAFSCRPLRQGKTIILMLLGIVSGFLLYFFKDMTFALGSSGGLPPVVAAWISPLVTLMIGAVLVFYQEDG